MPGSILIIDDEVRLGRALKQALDLDGHEVVYSSEPAQALRLLRERPFDVVLTDLVMPGMTGIDVLQRAKKIRPSCDVVVMTAFATVETAREALKRGAVDYVTKPFSPRRELAPLIAQILEGAESAEPDPAPIACAAAEGVPGVVGRSPVMRAIVEKLPRIASSRTNVLLCGESGTGKEVIANAIHRASPRRSRPFVKLNCAALSEGLLEAELFGAARGAYTGADRARAGLFQAADGGTLLLDEIGELPTTIQAKLLRVLQDGRFYRLGDSRGPIRVDVRVLAATNRDLQRAVGERSFRGDLYYRLNVVQIVLPPLRDRTEDLPDLIEAFLSRYARGRAVGVSRAARAALASYPWPGNVRELENAIEHALVLGDGRSIELEDLPAPIQDAERRREDGGSTLEAIEKRCIVQALARTGFNRTRAARLLGITRRTLGYRIRKYGLEGEVARAGGRVETQGVAAAQPGPS